MEKFFLKLDIFTTSESGVCADDFKNETRTVIINITKISSISSLMKFNTAFSNTYVAHYATVIMTNGIVFFIKKESYQNLIFHIENHIIN